MAFKYLFVSSITISSIAICESRPRPYISLEPFTLSYYQLKLFNGGRIPIKVDSFQFLQEGKEMSKEEIEKSVISIYTPKLNENVSSSGLILASYGLTRPPLIPNRVKINYSIPIIAGFSIKQTYECPVFLEMNKNICLVRCCQETKI